LTSRTVETGAVRRHSRAPPRVAQGMNRPSG
jgi:hypothetical protein